MALLTTFSDANKVTESFLSVRYTATFIEQDKYYTIVRTASKKYKYIGMTLSAAQLCKEAKISQFTYDVCLEGGKTPSTPVGSGDGVAISGAPSVRLVKKCVANVTVVHAENDSWECNIDVNEYDVLTSKSMPIDVAGIFGQYVNTRNYDEGNQLITVTNVVYSQVPSDHYSINFTGIQITYSNYYDFFVEFKENSSIMNWTSAVVDSYSYGTINFKGPATFSTGNIFRIRYKNYVSNVWIKGE